MRDTFIRKVSGLGVTESLRIPSESHEIGRENYLRESLDASWCSKNFQFVYFIVRVKKVSGYFSSSSDVAGSGIYINLPALVSTCLLVRGT